MKFDEISCYATVNATDGAKVAELAESMKENGWKGAPILVCNMGLVTGSHRLAALKAIDSDAEYDGEVLYEDVAEDVTDEINDYCEREGIGFEEIQFDNLRDVFAGTWVEEYKDETLYRKRTGEFFLHSEGGPRTRCAKRDGSGWAGGEEISPQSYEEAREWAEENMDADGYASVFGAPDDDGATVPAMLSISASAKAKLEREASRTGKTQSRIVEELIEAM